MASPFKRGSRTSSSVRTTRRRRQQDSQHHSSTHTLPERQHHSSTHSLSEKRKDPKLSSILTAAQATTPSAEQTAKPGNLQLEGPASLSFEDALILRVNQLCHIVSDMVKVLDLVRQRLRQAYPDRVIATRSSERIGKYSAQLEQLSKEGYTFGTGLRTKAGQKRRVGFDLTVEPGDASSKTQLQALSDGSCACPACRSAEYRMYHENLSDKLSDIYHQHPQLDSRGKERAWFTQEPDYQVVETQTEANDALGNKGLKKRIKTLLGCDKEHRQRNGLQLKSPERRGNDKQKQSLFSCFRRPNSIDSYEFSDEM